MNFKKPEILILVMIITLPGFITAGQTENILAFPVSFFQLKNGLNVILSEDYSLPLVTVAVAYKIGSRNDPKGRTGLAYLLENLMFQGSQNIRKMQHIRIIQRIGGRINAFTDVDKTIFFQTVSSNQLATVLWLESDRMKSLTFTPSDVAQAKNSLIAEIRNHYAADPYLENSIHFDKLLFPDFAYNHPVTGNENDLREITVNNVREFYATFYIPNNAVLCITGNINKRKAERLIRKYFENIPKGREIPVFPPTNNSSLIGITETHENPFASSPAFYIGYRIAPPHSHDYYSMVIIEYLLLKGESSRLRKRLLKKDRTALLISGGIEKRKNQAALKIFVKNTNDYMRDRSLKALLSEINKLLTLRIPENELIKAKNLFKKDYISQYSTSVDKAFYLTEAFLSGRSLEELALELNQYLSVTPIHIRGTINKYLNLKDILLNIRIK